MKFIIYLILFFYIIHFSTYVVIIREEPNQIFIKVKNLKVWIIQENKSQIN